MSDKETWLWLCSRLWDDWRMPIIEMKLYVEHMEAIIERHGRREGGKALTIPVDRGDYLALCEMFFDGKLNADGMATLDYLWRWIDAGKPGPERKRVIRDIGTEAERAADYARMDDRDRRGKGWRSD